MRLDPNRALMLRDCVRSPQLLEWRLPVLVSYGRLPWRFALLLTLKADRGVIDVQFGAFTTNAALRHPK